MRNLAAPCFVMATAKVTIRTLRYEQSSSFKCLGLDKRSEVVHCSSVTKPFVRGQTTKLVVCDNGSEP